MFEGMFVFGLQPDALLRAELKAAGFDLEHPLPEYPYEVWRKCLLIATRHTFPNENPDRAAWLLGERFIDGYLTTLVGKLIGVTMPFLSAKTLVQRSPRLCSSGITGAIFDLEWLGEQEAILKMPNLPWPNQFFTAGVTARCQAIIKSSMQITPQSLGAEGSQIHMKW